MPLGIPSLEDIAGAAGTQQEREEAPDPFQDPFREANQRRLEEEIMRSRGRGTTTGPTEFREGQITLAQQLAQQAAGQGPSLANLQLQQATDRTLSQALAQQASAGLNPALAQRGLLQQTSQIGQQAAGQSAQLALQEQLAARQQLGGVLGAGRAGDVQAQALEDQLLRAFLGAGLSLDQAQFMANQEKERLRVQEELARAGLSAQKEQARLGFVGGLLGAAGAGVAAGAT